MGGFAFMDELGREFAEDVGELVSGTGIAQARTRELRKRRSTPDCSGRSSQRCGCGRAPGRPF